MWCFLWPRKAEIHRDRIRAVAPGPEGHDLAGESHYFLILASTLPSAFVIIYSIWSCSVFNIFRTRSSHALCMLTDNCQVTAGNTSLPSLRAWGPCERWQASICLALILSTTRIWKDPRCGLYIYSMTWKIDWQKWLLWFTTKGLLWAPQLAIPFINLFIELTIYCLYTCDETVFVFWTWLCLSTMRYTCNG